MPRAFPRTPARDLPRRPKTLPSWKQACPVGNPARLDQPAGGPTVSNRFGVIHELTRKHEVADRRGHENQHDEKRREDSSHAPLIEPQSRKAAAGDFREDNDTDEIAGNYEENVNTKKPTRHPARAQMERQTLRIATALSPSMSERYCNRALQCGSTT